MVPAFPATECTSVTPHVVQTHRQPRNQLCCSLTQLIDDGNVATVVFQVFCPETIQRHQDEGRLGKAGNHRKIKEKIK